ncbi:hypothetical protein [Reyranella sp. CPCC 100927]|uniref:hypothetical protein n=1 Tax=Reyranella sp. CPCC 100927 TaxID=2599616 RepID=UPI0011B5B79E|nr:hypothetical protein [Reyranella sp. CPCC 100927]TWT09618.1 hypothetical protein FQU96_20880 [Reyranella sp. CPCC 100927]
MDDLTVILSEAKDPAVLLPKNAGAGDPPHRQSVIKHRKVLRCAQDDGKWQSQRHARSSPMAGLTAALS